VKRSRGKGALKELKKGNRGRCAEEKGGKETNRRKSRRQRSKGKIAEKEERKIKEE
jgi:hypothetical protein